MDKDYLRGVFSSLTADFIKIIAVLVGVAVLGFIANRVAVLTSVERCIVYGLYALVAACLLTALIIALARYLRLTHESSLPALAPQLPLLPQGFRVRRQGHHGGSNLVAPHVLFLELEISAPIKGHRLQFFCNGPVYRDACRFQQSGVDVGPPEAGSETKSVVVHVGGRAFADPGILTVELASIAPLEVLRIEDEPFFATGAMPSTRGELAAEGEPRSAIVADTQLQWLDNIVFLVISNRSGMASFWATIEVTAGLMSAWPKHEVFARWDHQIGVRAQIPKAGTHRLRVGRLEDDYNSWPIGKWSAFYTSEEGAGEAQGDYSFMYGTQHRDTVAGSAVEFRVTLYSEPALASGPIVMSILLVGGEIVVNGKRMTRD